MDLYKSLLDGNKQWVRDKLNQDPEYFENRARGQSFVSIMQDSWLPKFSWGPQRL